MDFNFVKAHGIGNDFIIIDDRSSRIIKKTDYGKLAKKICNRHFGIGADGIIIVLDSKTIDIKFRIFNADGSEAEMCGNGIRCFAKYLFENKIIPKKTFRIETKAGEIIPEIIIDNLGNVESVRVDMGKPLLAPADIPFQSSSDRAVNIPIEINGEKIYLTALSMGNPHAVIFVNDIENINIEQLGKQIEEHESFPDKTNVEFVKVINNNELKMRVWERGAGETLACGTGACAALTAAYLNKKTHRKALIHLKGGDLDVFWDEDTGHIFMTGPAEIVFTGIFNLKIEDVIMDFKTMGSDLGLDENEFRELAQLLVTISFSDLKKLEKGLKEKDANKIAMAAHSIKGASGNLGFMKISEYAAQIEILARDGTFSGIGNMTQNIKTNLDAIKANLGK